MLLYSAASAQCPIEISAPIGIFAPFYTERISEVSGFNTDRIIPGIYTGFGLTFAEGKSRGKSVLALNLAYHLKGFTTRHWRDIEGVGIVREDAILQRYAHFMSIGGAYRIAINNHSTRILAFQAKSELLMPIREEFELTVYSYRAHSDEVTQQTQYIVIDEYSALEPLANYLLIRVSPSLHYEHRITPYFAWLVELAPAITFRAANVPDGYNWLWGASINVGFTKCFPPRNRKQPRKPDKSDDVPVTSTM